MDSTVVLFEVKGFYTINIDRPRFLRNSSLIQIKVYNLTDSFISIWRRWMRG